MCYMTGILPIKKYGTASALNIFHLRAKLKPLANSWKWRHGRRSIEFISERMDYQNERLVWWIPYDTDTISTFSRLVVAAISKHDFSNYWIKTKSFEALKYIYQFKLLMD